MPGKIKFSYRAQHDVVVAEVHWKLETEEDVIAWCREYDTYFNGRFNRKVDLILELSDFHVSPRVASLLGKHRARILGQYTSHSYRVNQQPLERTFMHTSSVIHGAPANHYETVDAALAALLADRKAGSA